MRTTNTALISVLIFALFCSCRPINIPFYIGLVGPFAVVVLSNGVMLIAFYFLIPNLSKSQEKIHYIQSCLLSLLFGIGWTFGLAGISLKDIGADIITSIFCITGGLLGVYAFIIFCVLSPVVRSVWKEWFSKISSTQSKGYSPQSFSPNKLTDISKSESAAMQTTFQLTVTDFETGKSEVFTDSTEDLLSPARKSQKDSNSSDSSFSN